jgi:hypothetical protein
MLPACNKEKMIGIKTAFLALQLLFLQLINVRSFQGILHGSRIYHPLAAKTSAIKEVS